MNVYDAIITRRTIRRFKQKSIHVNILKKLVDCGRLSPSSANLQPCEYVIVNSPSKVKEVFQTLKWAGYIAPRGNPPENERPVAYIVVLLNLKKKIIDGERDAAAAIENIILAGLEEGIGSCWIGSIDRTKLQKFLNIPDHCKIDSVIALGYSNESPVVEEMKDSLKYWKDKDGVLHVPKRKLEDILHMNTY